MFIISEQMRLLRASLYTDSKELELVKESTLIICRDLFRLSFIFRMHPIRLNRQEQQKYMRTKKSKIPIVDTTITVRTKAV